MKICKTLLQTPGMRGGAIAEFNVVLYTFPSQHNEKVESLQ